MANINNETSENIKFETEARGSSFEDIHFRVGVGSEYEYGISITAKSGIQLTVEKFKIIKEEETPKN